MDIAGHAFGEFTEIGREGHQSALLDIVAEGIDHRDTVLRGQFYQQGTECQEAAAAVEEHGVGPPLCHIGKALAQLRFIHLRKKPLGQHQPQLLLGRLVGFAIDASGATVRKQVSDLCRRRHRLLQDLQALGNNFGPGFDANSGQVASRARQARDQTACDRVAGDSDNRYGGAGAKKDFDERIQV